MTAIPSNGKPTFNAVYEQWRDLSRRFNRTSMLIQALVTLRQIDPNDPMALSNAPWQTLLLVKWICQDRALDTGAGADVSKAEFDALRQTLWEIPDRTQSELDENLRFRLFVRQILRGQVGFQRGLTTGFVREAAMLLDLPANDPLHQLFKEKAGLRVQTFLDLSLLTCLGVLGGIVDLTSDFYEVLSPEYSLAETGAYVRLISRDADGLVAFCRGLPHAEEKKASEFHEFPALTRYPFIALDGMLHCWHPMVFLRGAEGLVHSILSEAGQAYMGRFGHAFERHVIRDAASVGSTLWREADLQKWLPQDSKVPDGLLSYPTCNVFIEAKAGIFDESVMTVGHANIFKHKTSKLIDAIGQAWHASVGLRASQRAQAQVRQAPVDYLLVVTNKELSVGDGEGLSQSYPPGTLSPPTAEAQSYLPLRHIFVVSIEDYEWLLAAVRAGSIDLPTFLGECVSANQVPGTATLYLHQHLVKRRIPMGFSANVESAFAAAEQRVREVVARGERDRILAEGGGP